MVWQDFMYACGEYPDHRSFLDEARREAEAVVLGPQPDLVAAATQDRDVERVDRRLQQHLGLVSGLAAILFYGGWNGPVPIFSEILPSLTGWQWAYQQGETGWRVLGYVSQVAGVLNFILKSCVFVTIMMWVRWTLPRLRIDQVITTCLKYCTPIAAVMFLCAALWQYALPHRNFFGLLNTPDFVYGVNEGWSAGASASNAEENDELPSRTVQIEGSSESAASASHASEGG